MVLIQDQQTGFDGGQDASLPPSRLALNRFVAGVNVSTSKGVLTPRWGFDRKKLTFQEGGFHLAFNKLIPFEKIYRTGRLQASIPYQVGSTYYQIKVYSGIIFLINQRTFEVRVLSQDKSTRLNDAAPRINWAPAGKYVVLCDWPNTAIIIEGQSARRADVDKGEIGVINHALYTGGRLVFANRGNEISAGDPVGSPITPDAPITQFEIIEPGSPYLAQVFQTPSEFDSPITALAKLSVNDQSTGIGATVVGTRKEIFVYHTELRREQWETTQSFGTLQVPDLGIAGARALVNVGGDLFYVSPDGQLRSLNASRDEQSKYARVPFSLEVDNWVRYNSDDLIQYSVLGYFRNKLFWTVRPYRIPCKRLDGSPALDVAHRGMVVLELDNVSRTGVDSPPAWTGLWTGVRPMDMLVNDNRMFIDSKDEYNRNELYEVLPELKHDRADKQRRNVTSVLYTREHAFGENTFQIKDLQAFEMGLTNIQGDFGVDVEWKPSQSVEYLFWNAFRQFVPFEYREIKDGLIPQLVEYAYREMRFGAPGFDTNLEKVKQVQFKVTITGEKWQLNHYRLIAESEDDSTDTDILKSDPELISTSIVRSSDWDYEPFAP